MNTIKKNLTYIVAFLLALGFASLANAEANNISDLVDGSSVTQSLDLNQQQTDVQQSVQPSCSNSSELDLASSVGTIQQPTPSVPTGCRCCQMNQAWCCSCKSMEIDTDAS